ncbi:hypothetical protein F4680DRAFT_427244 [Xylaria scruposa]|nr:hypothetical protein F4680DRAFT_427244 [Xylaria scruposa]
MLFIEKITFIMCLAIVSLAMPTRSGYPSFRRAQLDDLNPNILVQPKMYKVLPLETSQSGPAVSQLEVQRTGNVSTIENIAIFEGIPDDASTCMLGWIQAAKDKRDFTVIGNGLLAAQQLSKLPDGEVSWENIAPIADEAVKEGLPLLHPDTTDWSEVDTAARHIAGFVDCRKTIYLKLQVDDRDGDGYVYLRQNAQNGLTIGYQNKLLLHVASGCLNNSVPHSNEIRDFLVSVTPRSPYYDGPSISDIYCVDGSNTIQ